jgi:hypothetical protein
MKAAIELPGLRAESPAAALALYGIARLVESTATVRWMQGTAAGWHGEVVTGVAGDIDGLVSILVERIATDSLEPAPNLAKDLNELRPEGWRAAIGSGNASIARMVLGLSAEAPLRATGAVALSPLCVYSFGTRGTLFGNAAKADTRLRPNDLRAVLAGPWTPQKGHNTLGFDPGARRQDGALMGPDPSADGVRGVPGLVPLILRGLVAVLPMPGVRSARGGAFSRDGRAVTFRWPVMTTPTPASAVGLLAARDWTTRSAAQRSAAGVTAVFESRILRTERRLSHGRQVP